MPASKTAPGVSSENPAPDLVRQFMRDCNCEEQRAIQLLKLHQNDIAKAKRHHAAYMKLIKAQTPEYYQTSNAVPSDQEAASSDRSDSQASPKQPISANTPESESEKESPIGPYRHPNYVPPVDRNTDNGPQDRGTMPDSWFSKAPPGSTPETNGSGLPPDPDLHTNSQVLQGTQPLEELEDLELNEKPGDDASDIPRDWDFILPDPWPDSLVCHHADGDTFEIGRLVGSVYEDADVKEVQDYMELFDPPFVKKLINDEVAGFPAIFYAVATNDVGMVRLFLRYGADASAVHGPSQTPLLAFAIAYGEILQEDTTTIVSTLLCNGASPHVIPADIFTPYLRDSSGSSKSGDKEEKEKTELTQWCTDAARAQLMKAANISQRYYLERATKLKKPSRKRQQVARLRNAENLLGIPYFLVGQPVATDMLIQRLLTHLMMPTKRPLVLCFAGPSGHGKTELARQLGHLLSLDLEVVDCTIVKREMELFGPRQPYIGAERGSPVNNFLASHSRQRCIVFFDEFEKTTKEIHQALLLPFDNGEYQDRRNHDKIDCSNTIWILATNALDDTILDFCEKHDGIFNEDKIHKSTLVRQLTRQLQEVFLQKFDAPVTGRVSDFIPFLPFSLGEQAVITHKSLLELAQDLRRPINLEKGPQEQLVGDIRLVIKKDSAVCTMLAEAHYHPRLGARSLKAGAKKVERIVADAYLEEDEEIQEGEGLSDFIIDVQGGEIAGRAGKKTSQD